MVAREAVVLRERLVGAGFGIVRGFTVTLKLVLTSCGPSFTVTVIVALPDCPGTGVTVTVRLASFPPKTILPLGTRLGLEELALSCRFAAGVSASSTVKSIGPIVPFCGTI